MASESYVELIEEVKRELAVLQGQKFDSCTVTVDADNLTQQIKELAKNKKALKTKLHESLTLNTFMQNLVKPREEWQSIKAQADESMQEAMHSLKETKRSVKEQKTQMTQLIATTAEALAMYTPCLKQLEERLQCLENMTQELQALQNDLGDADDDEALSRQMQAEMAKQTAEMKEIRKQLQQLEHQRNQKQQHISQLRDDLQQLNMTFDEDQEKKKEQCLARLQKNVADMELFSGLKCKNVDANTIRVEFPPSQSAQSSGSRSDDDLVLNVTLTFKENSVGCVRLHDVKSNMESFDMEDLWKENRDGVADNLPKLISDIKLRWFSHVPLLSEINRLRSKYAIDWIQEENILRVIVGKGGSIVCSLDIPPGYPHKGQVVLSNVMGSTDTVVLEDLKPSTGTRLENWVDFLETVFGKP